MTQNFTQATYRLGTIHSRQNGNEMKINLPKGTKLHHRDYLIVLEQDTTIRIVKKPDTLVPLPPEPNTCSCSQGGCL